MIVYKEFPQNYWNKVAKGVFTNPQLSDGAVRLYGYLVGLKQGANFSDNYIIKALKISSKTLARRKKELVDAELTVTKQITKRNFQIFIGYPGFPAEDVYSKWLKEQDCTDDLIIDDEEEEA